VTLITLLRVPSAKIGGNPVVARVSAGQKKFEILEIRPDSRSAKEFREV
jgi:hypothetical protein